MSIIHTRHTLYLSCLTQVLLSADRIHRKEESKDCSQQVLSSRSLPPSPPTPNRPWSRPAIPATPSGQTILPAIPAPSCRLNYHSDRLHFSPISQRHRLAHHGAPQPSPFRANCRQSRHSPRSELATTTFPALVATRHGSAHNEAMQQPHQNPFPSGQRPHFSSHGTRP